MGEGMLGIFAVMLIIIGVIYALGHFTAKQGRINLNGRLTPRKSEKKRLFQKRWTETRLCFGMAAFSTFRKERQDAVDMDCKNGYNESKSNVRSVKKHGKIYGRDL